jgi:hypothetical protein
MGLEQGIAAPPFFAALTVTDVVFVASDQQEALHVDVGEHRVSGNLAAIFNVDGLYQRENGAEENQGVQVDLCSAIFLQEPVCRVAATDRNLCRIARVIPVIPVYAELQRIGETIETAAEERIRL